MKTVDVYVAGAKSLARNLAAQHFEAHGFLVRWYTPWYASAVRGFSLPHALDPDVSLKPWRVGFDFRVMDAPADIEGGADLSVLRLERRLLPLEERARDVVEIVDEFELICDEIVADLQAHELVVGVETIGIGAMIPPLQLGLPRPPAPT